MEQIYINFIDFMASRYTTFKSEPSKEYIKKGHINKKEKVFLRECKKYIKEQKKLEVKQHIYSLTNTCESDLIKMWKKHFDKTIKNWMIPELLRTLFYKEDDFEKINCKIEGCVTPNSSPYTKYSHRKCKQCKNHCNLKCVWYTNWKRLFWKKWNGGYFRYWSKNVFWWCFSRQTAILIFSGVGVGLGIWEIIT